MPKGVLNKKYSGEFKQQVVETMRQEGLTYKETERRFELPHNRAGKCEHIYLEEKPEGLNVEYRGRASAASGTKKGRPSKLDKKAQVDYLKT